MSGQLERLEARERAICCAIDILALTMRIGDDARAFGKLMKADTAFELACRDLTNVIDDLPPGSHPKGWATTPDEVPA